MENQAPWILPSLAPSYTGSQWPRRLRTAAPKDAQIIFEFHLTE
jgi:hypothetical protein